ncbi:MULTISPECIES: hypothetical protein [Xanthobacteraceae]|uniref:hypothetical protein n=1 Tax=Xanthobacteraceae TaxID=335928 RepID=UPI001FCE3976|nr:MULTISPECIES: hypothetical protein [Xanthobacteraceae]
MADQRKTGVPDEMFDVTPSPGGEIIQAYDMISLIDQSIAQVRAEKSSAAGNKNATILSRCARNMWRKDMRHRSLHDAELSS